MTADPDLWAAEAAAQLDALLSRLAARLTEDAAPPVCHGQRRQFGGALVDCPDPVTHEALLTCHGISKTQQVCSIHAHDLIRREASECGTCRTIAARLVAILPTRTETRA